MRGLSVLLKLAVFGTKNVHSALLDKYISRYLLNQKNINSQAKILFLPDVLQDLEKKAGPANSKYSTLESRLKSFKDWPKALSQQPKQLAEAGFYYIGFGDQTECFYCDGGLEAWLPEEDPWTEHAQRFPKCGFVRLIKGKSFLT